MNRAYLFFLKEDYDSMEKDIRSLLQFKMLHFQEEIYNIYAWKRYREKEYQEAVNYFRKGIELSPWSDFYYSIGLCLHKLESNEEALENLNISKSLNFGSSLSADKYIGKIL